MRKFSFRAFKTTEYQRAALEYLAPPEDLTVSEWAEKYRVLDARSSALPGRWRNEMTPYLTEIMDALNRPDVEEIAFVKPTQVGGTEALLNLLGYVIAQDPAPTMIVYPTDTLGDSVSENRIIPMIRSSKALAKKYNERGSAKMELQFDGMYVSIVGANSPSALASKPIRYLFFDEVDKFPAASKREADPVSLAKERTKTFVNRKIYMCSTPTLATGHIWKAKETADEERHFFIPCPHCGEMIELEFEQIKWAGEDSGLDILDRVDMAVYVCQACGCVISDAEKNRALTSGEWRKVRGKGGAVRRLAYWLNTLYSPFVRFADVAKEFILSKDDPDQLHNFVNSWLAEPWEETKVKTSESVVMERQTETPCGVVPEWARLITAGVDVQESCLYWSIRAWGDYMTSQNVAHGRAYCFEEVEEAMNKAYPREDGGSMVVDLCLVDSGDQTDEVYEFCSRNSEWALPCKGTGAQLSHYRVSTVNKIGSSAYGMHLGLVDGGKYKDMIASRMKRQNGKGAWMVYGGCDDEYAMQVTAEQKVTTKNSKGQIVSMWKPKNGIRGKDNHYLDCEVYAFAAADLKGVRSLFLTPDTQEGKAAVKPKQEPRPEEEWIRSNEGWL